MTPAIQLPQILVRNSFNILGLSSSSALKEIRKRSQQLLQLAKIEEVQEFDIDIGDVRVLRNESEIRVALERVSGIQERLKEIFFWFEDHRTESRKALEFISKGNYQKAITIFEASGSDWLDKKNFALALMFQAFATSSMESFCRSLEVWRLIADSDNFWKFYETHYLLHDELGTAPSLLEEFRSSLFETLSAKAVFFYHQTKNPKVLGACYSVFGKIGKTADSEILQPVILKVKMEMAELEKAEDATSKKKVFKKIHKCFSELEEFELLEYSPLVVLKNDIAEKLKSIAVDIYNENADTETARILLEQSSKLAVSEALLDRIESNIKQLKENSAWESVSERFNHIKNLIEKQKLEEARGAYLRLDNDLVAEAAESSTSNRIHLLINYCSSVMQKGHELFDKKKFGIRTLAISAFLNRKNQRKGILAFEHAKEILQDRLYLFDFLDAASDRSNISKTIDNISNDLRYCELESLFDRHQAYLQVMENTAHDQPDENTQIAIKLLGAAICFSILYRRCKRVYLKTLWKWIGSIAAIFFYFCVIMLSDKQTSKSSYKRNSYPTKSSYSSGSPSHQLTKEEKVIIDYLQKNNPEVLKKVRKEGYSDKQIARYVIEHAEDEE